MNDNRLDDAGFSADAFLALAQRVWQRDDDASRAADALTRSVNIRT